MKLIADILVVTVNATEGRAVLNTFREATGQIAKVVNIGNLAFHDLGLVNQMRVAMVQCEMGSMGLGASLQTVQEAIGTAQPGAVVMAGVAFGAKPDKQEIGRVLVSKQVQFYEPQRIGATSIPRGSKVDPAAKLLNHFRASELHWDDSETQIEFGLILSGEKLIDNLEFLTQLLKAEPEAIGGEMEGAGLYVACQQAKRDWILAKGICDWADGNKSENKISKTIFSG